MSSLELLALLRGQIVGARHSSQYDLRHCHDIILGNVVDDEDDYSSSEDEDEDSNYDGDKDYLAVAGGGSGAGGGGANGTTTAVNRAVEGVAYEMRGSRKFEEADALELLVGQLLAGPRPVVVL